MLYISQRKLFLKIWKTFRYVHIYTSINVRLLFYLMISAQLQAIEKISWIKAFQIVILRKKKRLFILKLTIKGKEQNFETRNETRKQWIKRCSLLTSGRLKLLVPKKTLSTCSSVSVVQIKENVKINTGQKTATRIARNKSCKTSHLSCRTSPH